MAHDMNDLIVRKGNDLVIQVNDYAFYTTYDPLLDKVLGNVIRGYKVNQGTRPEEKAADNPALIFRVKNGYGPTKDIAFAETIVRTTIRGQWA